MKRKTKIITTIASLCLAVALMAFGVYAATTVTLGVVSKVEFTVRDVFVRVDGQAKMGFAYTTNQTGSEALTAADQGATGTHVGPIAEYVVWADAATNTTFGNTEGQIHDDEFSYQSYTGLPTDDVKTPINPSAGASGTATTALTWDLGKFAYDASNVWYEIDLTIKNDAAEGYVYVRLNSVFVADTGANSWYQSVQRTYATGADAATIEGTAFTALTANTPATSSAAEGGVITLQYGNTLELRFRRRVKNVSKAIAEMSNFGSDTNLLVTVNKVEAAAQL